MTRAADLAVLSPNVAVSGSNIQFDSGYGSVATAYGCRAWVNFNGTGTVAIRASGNVSSITDVNSGRYVVNLATALPDSDGAAVATAIPGTASDANGNRVCFAAQISTTTVRLNITSNTGSTDWQDSEFIACAIFR